MTSRQLGHRAAAQGAPREAPVSGDPVGWMLAYDAVEKHRANGLDPNGHTPEIPHLCERDVSKVCNCCPACKTACWSEGVAVTIERKITSVRDVVLGLLRRVRGR